MAWSRLSERVPCKQGGRKQKGKPTRTPTNKPNPPTPATPSHQAPPALGTLLASKGAPVWPLLGRVPEAPNAQRVARATHDKPTQPPKPPNQPKTSRNHKPRPPHLRISPSGERGEEPPGPRTRVVPKRAQKMKRITSRPPGKGREGAPQHNPKNHQPTTTKGGEVACIVIRRMCNRRGESTKSSLRHQKKRGHKRLQEYAPPKPASLAGAGWPGVERKNRNHNNPNTNQPDPSRQPGHPVLLPQAK